MFSSYKANRSFIMSKYIIRKLAVILIITLPLFSWSGCKKQAKCGCGKDVLYTITKQVLNRSSIVFGTDGATASFQMGYDTYYFCNPVEMYAIYNNLAGEDQILISGDVFWECTYLMNSGSSQYYQMYRVYNIDVSALEAYVYGKK
jgi:hypothetical protein